MRSSPAVSAKTHGSEWHVPAGAARAAHAAARALEPWAELRLDAPPVVFVLPLGPGWNDELLDCPAVRERLTHKSWPYGNEAISGPVKSEYDFETWPG